MLGLAATSRAQDALPPAGNLGLLGQTYAGVDYGYTDLHNSPTNADGFGFQFNQPFNAGLDGLLTYNWSQTGLVFGDRARQQEIGAGLRAFSTGYAWGKPYVEAGGGFAKGAADFGARVVATISVVFADAKEEVCEPVYITAEGLLFDGELFIMSDGVEVGRFPSEVPVNFCELAKAIGMHEETVTDVEEVVAAGTFDGPVGAEELARLENLFADDPSLWSMLAKTGEVLEWIAQAIGMIDTYAVEYALIEPLEDAAMG